MKEKYSKPEAINTQRDGIPEEALKELDQKARDVKDFIKGDN